MKHTALLSSASITLILTLIIATGGCKKDEVNGPASASDAWTVSGNDIYASNTGNIGFGTTTPNDELHIKRDVNSFVGLTLENTTAGNSSAERISFVDENGNLAYIQCTDAVSVSGPAMTIAFNRPNGFIAMNTAGTTRLVINNAGNVGIGTTIPSQKLTVSGNICATGSIGACSDIRYKKDITPMTDALNKILSLHGIYYNWDKKKIGKDAYTPERQVGFSAQEVEKYFPEIVQTDAKGYKAVDYSRLTPMLVEAMKEQQEVIERQRVQMDQQENGLQQLRNEMTELKALIKKESK